MTDTTWEVTTDHSGRNATGKIVSTRMISPVGLNPKMGEKWHHPKNRVSGFGGKTHHFLRAKIGILSNLRAQ
jgi:hypothetical protein